MRSCSSRSRTARAPATKTGPTGRRRSSGSFTATPRSTLPTAKPSTASRQIEREDLHSVVSSQACPPIFRTRSTPISTDMPDRYFQTYSVRRNPRAHPPLPRFPRAPTTSRQPARPRHQAGSRSRTEATREFWFCGWDRKELLARIAGSLSVAQLNILSRRCLHPRRQPRARYLPRLQHAPSRRSPMKKTRRRSRKSSAARSRRRSSTSCRSWKKP